MPPIIKIILYPFVALFFLLLFTLILFPFDSLKERLVQEVQRAVGHDYQVQIENISYFPPATLTLKGVSVGAGGSPSEANLPKAVAKFERVKLVFQPVALLWGRQQLHFDLKEKKTHLEGDLYVNKEQVRMEADIDKLDLVLVRVLLSRWKIPIDGDVSGRVDLDIYIGNPLKNSGSVELQFGSLRLGPVDYQDVLNLPVLSLAGGANTASAEVSSRIELKINRANVNVEAFELHGEDAELSVSGKVYGSKNIESYRFNLRGNMRLAPALAEKVPILALIDSYKDATGSYPLTVTGRISGPNIRIGDFKVPF